MSTSGPIFLGHESFQIRNIWEPNIFHYFPSENLKYSQIFLSETIHAQENGSRGPHFAKSLNSNFLKGLTYSALIGCASAATIIRLSALVLIMSIKRVNFVQIIVIIILIITIIILIIIIIINLRVHTVGGGTKIKQKEYQTSLLLLGSIVMVRMS